MKESRVLDELNRIKPADYVGQVRRLGRSRLDPYLRDSICSLYEEVRDLRRQDRLSRQAATLLRFVEPALQSEWMLGQSADPLLDGTSDSAAQSGCRYLSYTNVRVLNNVLGTNAHTTDSHVEHACWQTIRYLAKSWANYEIRTITGREKWNQGNRLDVTQLQRRVEMVSTIYEVASFGALSPTPNVPIPQTWNDYATESGKYAALEYLTALPQTQQHDEVTFLRTIHITECCLWGMLVRIMSAIEYLKSDQLSHAAECLRRAARFAGAQTSTMSAMQTMPPEHFAEFRDATGNASAVQSRTNQLVYAFLFGIDAAKVTVLDAAPETRHILHYSNARFVTLWQALHTIDLEDPAASAVIDAAARLDAEMHRWRGKHYGVAVKYLPPETEGTGGTSGAAYLRAFIKHRFRRSDPSVNALNVSVREGTRARGVLGWEN